MLSVIIIAKNEETNIRRCLESVAFADELIVLDSGSSDATVKIAKEFTPLVFETNWEGYGIQKQRALAKATGEWVLNLDADESVSEALQAEIKHVISTDEADGYRVSIQMNFYNKPLNYSSSPRRHLRLFKREGAFFSHDIVHEKIILPSNARLSKVKHSIMHHSFKDLSHALYKMNKYSSYSAKIAVTSKNNPSFIKPLISASWMFIRCYILQRGFLDGQVGFLFAVVNAQGSFYRGMKQVYQDLDLDNLPQVITPKD